MNENLGRRIDNTAGEVLALCAADLDSTPNILASLQSTTRCSPKKQEGGSRINDSMFW